MSSSAKSMSCYRADDNDKLRRGPWTLEEDNLLIHFIAHHGEGRWNLLAKCSGLRRTGKSCRLRWLNYLKPDVKRGNLSAQEQLLILDLHSKWGNRWSKIAQFLPGRTDNEIKNFWRTRVQKQAKYLNIDTNSHAFHEIIRCYWIPRLIQRIDESSSLPQPLSTPATAMFSQTSLEAQIAPAPAPAGHDSVFGMLHGNGGENSGKDCLRSFGNCSSQLNQISENLIRDNCGTFGNDWHQMDNNGYGAVVFDSATAAGDFCHPPAQCHVSGSNWVDADFDGGYMPNMDELWQFKN